MNSFLALVPLVGVGVGLATAYGVTHRDRRIHFVERKNLETELTNLSIDVNRAETCIECGDEIDPEDIGAIVRENGGYRTVCEKQKCLDTYDLE